MSNIIPIELEALGFKFKNETQGKNNGLDKTTSIASQGNEHNLHYIIKFSDGSQKVNICNGNKLQIDLIIWLWRINNKKTEEDYVDFGIDFSTLRRGIVISNNRISNILSVLDTPPKNFSEVLHRAEIEQTLKNFLKSEIQRYFKEQKNDIVVIEATMGGGLRISPKTNELVWVFIGLLVLFPMFGNFLTGTTSPNQVSGSQSNSQAKQDTYECAEKTGMGETVSGEDIDNLDRCLREKGYFNQR